MAGFDNDTMFAQVGSDVGVFPNTTSSDNSTEFSRSGSDVLSIVNNTSDTANSGARLTTRVEADAAGDPYLKLQVGSTTSFSIGIDNSDSDLFKINTDLSGSVSPSTGTNLFNLGPVGAGGAFVGVFDIAQLLVRHDRTDAGTSFGLINSGTTGDNTVARLDIITMSPTGDAYNLFIVANASPGASAWNVGIQGDPDGDFQFRTPVNAGIPPINGTIRMNMTTGGAITFPTTPAFLAFVNASVLNVTGDGTVYTVIFNTEVFDQGGNFNTTTGIFTAPVTGRYTFHYAIEMAGVTVGMTQGVVIINTSNRFYRSCFNNVGAMRSSINEIVIPGSATCDMDAADTAQIDVDFQNGTLVADVRGDAGNAATFFSGELSC